MNKTEEIKTMTIGETIKKVASGNIKSDITIQREIVYSDEKQAKVIDSVLNDIPLPSFYLWRNKEGNYEVLDGKQRIKSFERFWNNELPIYGNLRLNTPQHLQDKIENKKLNFIISSGSEEHKRNIFYRINTLGIPLSKFEVLNGLYNGNFINGLNDALLSDKAINKVLGVNSRGKNNFKVLELLSGKKKFEEIMNFVKKRQNENFQIYYYSIKKEFAFINTIFKNTKKDFAILWKLANKYSKSITIWKQHKNKINEWIKSYTKTDSYKLDKNKYQTYEDGILAVLNNIEVDEQRLFSETQKQDIIKRDGNLCKICNNELHRDEMTFDHINPWSKGGRTLIANGQILCKKCNSTKGNK